MSFVETFPRRGFVSASLNSRLYIWGGETSDKRTSHLTCLYIFDITTRIWTSSSLKGEHPLGYIRCTAAQDGKLLYIYGGKDDNIHYTGSLYCLDLEGLSWTHLSKNVVGGPMKKISGGMVVHGNKIFLFGGVNINGVTNELLKFDLSTSSWSTPNATGVIPPPCQAFSFIKVNDTIMMFGGGNQDGLFDELYTLNLNDMHWTKIPKNKEEPWPEERAGHASCCIGVDTSCTQLMITGGFFKNTFLVDDMWLLDISSMNWRKVTTDARLKRCYHTAVVVQVTEDVYEVVVFGGWGYDVGRRTYPCLSETIMRLEKENADSATNSSPCQWKITNIADKAQLETQERLQYKKKLQVDTENDETESDEEPPKEKRQKLSGKTKVKSDGIEADGNEANGNEADGIKADGNEADGNKADGNEADEIESDKVKADENEVDEIGDDEENHGKKEEKKRKHRRRMKKGMFY